MNSFSHAFFFSGKLDDGDKMVPAIKKNFAELETGLVHLQQNIDIPEINLVIHPQILAVSYMMKLLQV